MSGNLHQIYFCVSAGAPLFSLSTQMEKDMTSTLTYPATCATLETLWAIAAAFQSCFGFELPTFAEQTMRNSSIMVSRDDTDVQMATIIAFGRDLSAVAARITEISNDTAHIAFLCPKSRRLRDLYAVLWPQRRVSFDQDIVLGDDRWSYQVWSRIQDGCLAPNTSEFELVFHTGMDGAHTALSLGDRAGKALSLADYEALPFGEQRRLSIFLSVPGFSGRELTEVFNASDLSQLKNRICQFGLVPAVSEAFETGRCLRAIRMGSNELEEIVYDGASALAQFLEVSCVYNTQNIIETATYDHLDDLWEMFGTLRACRPTLDDNASGVFELSSSSFDYCMRFSIPFDDTGALAGPARLILENRSQVLWQHTFPEKDGQFLIREAADEISEFLEAPTPEHFALGLCMPDHANRVAALLTRLGVITGQDGA